MLLLLGVNLVVASAALLFNYFLIKLLKGNFRERERERMTYLGMNRDLTDRIMHMNGSTWTPPPRVVVEEELDPEFERHKEGWTEV